MRSSSGLSWWGPRRPFLVLSLCLLLPGCYQTYLIEKSAVTNQASHIPAVRDSDGVNVTLLRESYRIEEQDQRAVPAGQIRVRGLGSVRAWMIAGIVTGVGGTMASVGPPLAFGALFDCGTVSCAARLWSGTALGLAGGVLNLIVGPVLFGVAQGKESPVEDPPVPRKPRRLDFLP